MANFIIPYTTPADYTYDDTKITVENNVAKLKLQNQLVTFNEDFADDTDFTYDSDLAEFVGGKVQQINQRPTDAIFYASFNKDKDGDWGDGDLTGTLLGSASVSGGQLNCTSSASDGISYDCIGNADFTNQCCIRFKIIPNYNGTPAVNSYIFGTSPAVTNEIFIRHNNGGNLVLVIRSNVGGFIVNQTIGTWNAVLGQEYEFELNIDLISGATRLFIDGVQSGVNNYSHRQSWYIY